jgi:hypothetical protein
MISIMYLLTSKWHDVDEFALFLVAMVDLAIVSVIAMNV